MSFPADPVLLFAAGELYARLLPESAQGGMATAAGTLKVGAFEAAGIACYLDADWPPSCSPPIPCSGGSAGTTVGGAGRAVERSRGAGPRAADRGAARARARDRRGDAHERPQGAVPDRRQAGDPAARGLSDRP